MTKILLVEDDKSLREIYGVRLLAEGYDIVSAGDGEEALATAIKEKPDLIVSDVMMPKISGFDMLDILRSTPETKDIRVIMMTALSSDDQRDRGEKLGADRYLVKSQVGIEDVVRTVHEVLGDAPIAAPQFSSMQSQQQPQPQPQPQQFVEQPQPPAPQAQPNEPEQLPQPTAPFSSPRPATLGERIIHPIESAASQSNNANEVSLADRISAELEQANAQAQQSPQAQPEPVQQAPQAQPEPVQQAPQQQVQQQQPQVQQVPVQQQDYQMPQAQQFEQPQAQQPVAQPQETTPETQPIQLSQPEMQMPQQQTQPQMQMQQAPQPTQPQQSPTESPQPLQIDPNDVNHGRTFNVPPRQ